MTPQMHSIRQEYRVTAERTRIHALFALESKREPAPRVTVSAPKPRKSDTYRTASERRRFRLVGGHSYASGWRTF